jgi:hypothetical protein
VIPVDPAGEVAGVVGTWPTKKRTGVESCIAVWIPIAALVAPGPRVTNAAAGRRASFA